MTVPRTHRATARLLLSVLLGLVPAAGWACTPLDPERRQEDRLISVAPDGSFVDAAEDDIRIGVTGRPVRDIGGGRVGQIIEASENCAVYQILLFADCTTGEAIFVRGLESEGNARWAERAGLFDWPIMESTRALQAPEGPLALTQGTTVADILALAAQREIEAFDDVASFMATIEAHNRFDPFLGCEIFYPGSVGAGR